MKVPNWLYFQWFHNKNYKVESVLGYLNESFFKLLYLKKDKTTKEKTILTLYQNKVKNDIRLPSKLNIELKINRKHEDFKHGEYTKKQKYQQQIVFKSQKECMPGFRVTTITNFKNKSRRINGIIKKDLGDEIEILIDNSDKLEIFSKKNAYLLSIDGNELPQTCSILGLIKIIIQAKPIMNKKYALWLKNFQDQD